MLLLRPRNMNIYLPLVLFQHVVFSQCLQNPAVGGYAVGSCNDSDFRVINNSGKIVTSRNPRKHFYEKYENLKLTQLEELWNWPRWVLASDPSTFHRGFDGPSRAIESQSVTSLDSTNVAVLSLEESFSLLSTESARGASGSFAAIAAVAAKTARNASLQASDALRHIHRRAPVGSFTDLLERNNDGSLRGERSLKEASSYSACPDRGICAHPSTPFLRILDECGRRSLGDATATSHCLLQQLEKELQERVTPSCAFCFGMSAACARSHCRAQCLLSTCSTICLKCAENNCRRDLVKCTGAEDHQLPEPCSP